MLLKFFIALCMLTLPLMGQESSQGFDLRRDLQIGHWVEVRGRYLAGGTFEAEKISILQPDDKNVLIGTVRKQDVGGEGFLLFGQPVQVTDRTAFRKMSRSSLPGARIKLEGYWRGPRKFSSRTITARGAGRDRLVGRVEELSGTDSGLELSIMRFKVLVPSDVEVELEAPLEEIELAPERAAAPVGKEFERRDEDDLFGRGIRLLDGLILRGQIEMKVTDEDEYDLDRTQDADRIDTDAIARIRLVYAPKGAAWYAVAEGRYTYRWRDDHVDGHLQFSNPSLGETFLYVRDAFGDGWDLQVGRQDFDDPREWIYDQNLDAVRVLGHFGTSRLELSASTTLADGKLEDEAATNWTAYLSHELAGGDIHLAAWSQLRDFEFDDQTIADEERLYFGVRALGDFFADQSSWLDLALLTGERKDVDLGGWAYDVGTTWTPDWMGPFSITAAYALGSGGAVDAQEDNRFRQTGLEDNTTKFDGVTSFQYYGELLDPELSNIGIATVGIGARVAKRTSLDLVWHGYRQDHLLDLSLPGADIDDRPNGDSPDLGWELDLILGSRRWNNIDIELVAGWFRPGDAFPGADDAFLGKAQIRYRF